jgi:3-polyprenyl-4-hydroxybenzoate decarboxylase
MLNSIANTKQTKTMKKILEAIEIAFSLKYWDQTKTYSKELDNVVSKLIRDYEFTNISYHTAMIGGVELWIANIPYSCMMPIGMNVRPSRITIKRGVRKLQAAQKAIIEEKIKQQLEELRLKL